MKAWWAFKMHRDIALCAHVLCLLATIPTAPLCHTSHEMMVQLVSPDFIRDTSRHWWGSSCQRSPYSPCLLMSQQVCVHNRPLEGQLIKRSALRPWSFPVPEPSILSSCIHIKSKQGPCPLFTSHMDAILPYVLVCSVHPSHRTIVHIDHIGLIDLHICLVSGRPPFGLPQWIDTMLVGSNCDYVVVVPLNYNNTIILIMAVVKGSPLFLFQEICVFQRAIASSIASDCAGCSKFFFHSTMTRKSSWE